MKKLIVKITKIAFSIWKPDFRKTTGWVFITTGLVTLAPPFIHDIILNLLGLVDIKLKAVEHQDTVGALLIAIGVLYHMFYMSIKKDIRTVEVVLGILIISSVALLIAITL